MIFDNTLKIGILGGGQLGKMLIQTALDLDLDINVLDNDANCSCSQIANRFVKGDIADFDSVYAFGKDLDVITIEIENVNIKALKKLQDEGKKVFPQPQVVEIIKDKCTQKKFFKANNIPTSEFILVDNLAQIYQNKDFLPAVNKIGVGGYDGRGVQTIKSEKDIEKGFDAPGILEKFVDFEKELAVIVARNTDGDVETFPVVEMVFHPVANLVEYLFSPAAISDDIAEKAKQIAIKTIKAFDMVGLLAVEMFLTKNGEILVNEVAPRPHNSGHHTQKANLVSQYDQHWRAILGLPLGDTKAISTAAMVNILGAEGHEGDAKVEGLEVILKEDNIFPFFYGKKKTKPFRKMGHVSILAADFEKLKEKVTFVQENLRVISK
ncbi:5-(carboxyamino)imidazole ribonucleotide synthase [Lacihabitans sp. LS3-19]|uniref:5-(carboxyamino)imidazole ribonucleotide synthase n=1 Tax=Lacihabitans sp. LS3-19 TaxID=2487335 RepID=UPI0020CE9998|nr:5-(carboxyamino)imidazole ribonucleotide synthase [Lacihabitans sp. LS3-19]MCP9768178.1 5-(carboxyamino)imidazole ribonucleotide synthase [Lacihabitans sp. LS3-19]